LARGGWGVYYADLGEAVTYCPECAEQEFGTRPDESADGTYSGRHWFRGERDRGVWLFYVIAQDVNSAQPDMSPEEAAKIIGGLVGGRTS
jgi:hypothetical protein